MLFKKLSGLLIIEIGIMILVAILCVLYMNNMVVYERVYETFNQSATSAKTELDDIFKDAKDLALESCVNKELQIFLHNVYYDETVPSSLPTMAINSLASEC